MDGKLISTQKTIPNNTLKISAETWRGGMYFVEVIQGGQRQVIKL
jgi:hypothetical protein